MAKKTTKSAKATDLKITPIDPEPKPKPKRKSVAPAPIVPTAGIVDPLGDPADGEARTYLGDESDLEVSTEDAASGQSEPAVNESALNESATAEENAEAVVEAEEPENESESGPAPKKPAKLERLQKILSQAGVASRRKAEEMIEQGRVQVNGTVVTELGTKADLAHDHIRVDGKLLHGAERLRYFVLNKPKGFVTTVRDPEGRPTVMKFFEKMRERLYPVGRLDYMSEGLLLVTNDGELANRLTKAGSGVEKTYLVKVAGQPTEEELGRLRGGVAIERGQPGSTKVRTAPARIRQVRQGDNPWYEVVLIEGRNRELRKMFSSIGHFVEKIRRVGYGPLVLDVEPGELRELEPEELAELRLVAEGKLLPPKAKEIRRRNRADAELPTVRPKPSLPRPGTRPLAPRTFDRGSASEVRSGEFRPQRSFGPGKPSFGAGKPFRGERPARPEFRPAGEGGYRGRPTAGARFENKPFKGKPAGSGRFADRPFKDKPATDKPRWRNAEGERPRQSHPQFGGSRAGGASFERPKFDRPKFDKPRFNQPKSGRPPQRSFGGPRRSDWAGTEQARPPRGNDEFERPMAPRSGQQRSGGPRPGGKTFRPGGQGGSRPAGKPFRPGGQGGSRPAFSAGSRPRGAAGSNPRSGSGGPPNRGAGAGSKPQSRGFGKAGERKSGFQNRGGSARRGGPRSGGKGRS